MVLANLLIRQGFFAFVGILMPIFSSFFVPNYSSLSQHMSEMQVLPHWFMQYSLFTGMISLFFMWILIVGIEPQEYMGLTQRISSIFSFGWFAVAAFVFKPQT
jgi:hypothetical protein